MPFVTAGESTRREWMRRIGAGVAVWRSTATAAQGSTRWALLSDTHIPADPQNQYRGFFPQENLKRVLPGVQKFRPEGVVISGDLARLEGLAADYEVLKRFLAPVSADALVALGLGNHDHRKNFLEAFGSAVPGTRQTLRNRHVVVMERGPVRLIVLDSLIEANLTPGLLGKEQRTWLDEYLSKAAPMPTLLFVHHTLDDADGSLLDSDRFLRIVTRHPAVKAVFYGHSHVYAYDKLEGVHLVNVPAVGYNFRDSEPVGWVEALFSATGAELTLRAIAGDRSRDGKATSLTWR